MHNKPLVSVIMPVRNVAERFLTPAIESILEQTFPHFEFLIVNDGSTDDTFQRLRRFADADERIKLFHTAGVGIPAALNLAIKHAEGDFLARMDGDDISTPDRFAEQVAYLQAHPECVAVGADVLMIDPDGAPLTRLWTHPRHDHIEKAFLFGMGGAIVHPLVMMRRDAVMAAGMYDTRFKYAEDLDLFLKLCELGRVANIPKVLLHYRQQLQSVCHNRLPEQAALGHKIVMEARARRGLPMLDIMLPTTRMMPPGLYHFRWAKMAFFGKHYRTARKHFFKALLRMPLELISWVFFISYYVRRRFRSKVMKRPVTPRPRFGAYAPRDLEAALHDATATEPRRAA